MKRMKIMTLTILCLMFIIGVYACADTNSLTKVHPTEIKELSEAVCSACHEDDRASMDHKEGWINKHGFYAGQRKQVCSLCHEDSFCSECHANKPGLIPSDMHKDKPDNFYPHRGDYLTQHMIDGRVNPAPCMKCHGRQNNSICRTCHK
ncbi:MAG: cytochrome C [Nitrospirae bacterium]|nr:cytochrome C [Nitrospirota bacterium]